MRNLIVSAPRMLALLEAILFIGATAKPHKLTRKLAFQPKMLTNPIFWLKMKTNKRTILKKTQKINCN